VHILMASVRVSPRNHIHSELPATGRELAEGIPVAEPFASVMHRYLSRIKSNDPTRAETCRIDMCLLKVVEPEGGIIVARIIFHKGHLGPAHGTVVPAGRSSTGLAALHQWRRCQKLSFRIKPDKACSCKSRSLLDEHSSVIPHFYSSPNELVDTDHVLIADPFTGILLRTVEAAQLLTGTAA